MNQEPEDEDLEPEYDFTGAVRGKYFERYQEGSKGAVELSDIHDDQITHYDHEQKKLPRQ